MPLEPEEPLLLWGEGGAPQGGGQRAPRLGATRSRAKHGDKRQAGGHASPLQAAPYLCCTCLRRDPRAKHVCPCLLPTSDTRPSGGDLSPRPGQGQPQAGLDPPPFGVPIRTRARAHTHHAHAARERPRSPTCPLTKLAANCLMTASTV